ncbi:LuxR family transcriptional regulator [Nonomuraea sp. PA05]|uniref:ATP-binding protein n=1 Tax=Nonomuraea sp. PA05 TaxID=2604466 RepID=UPI0011DA3EC1|nr:LuxR family transcriptional regulator [Nonomuraea sp. PA05]TYB58397.1 LuxR family transcriptional regulator [Nonomuraea sp. PA05]
MVGAAGQGRAGNLPLETTSLIGRHDELARMGTLLEQGRLVTVTGVAGVGKTRLALRAAATLQPRLTHGAWWVPLSPIGQPGAVRYTIAEALPLADRSTRPMGEVLAEYLADRELLLVLDTCEHLIDECAAIVGTLLEAAPGLRVLATSRRSLDLPEEEVLLLGTLPVPGANGRGRTGARKGVARKVAREEVAREEETRKEGAREEAPREEETEAVRLLAERAAAALPGFTLDERNREAAVRVCRRLEGLPLAIELAAARLAEMPMEELADRLSDRLSLLGDTAQAVYGTVPPWHQALRTAIGWSHQLCTSEERLTWARLSVFAGSFDAAAAAQVCGDERLAPERVPGLLATLATKSLLIWEPTGGGERYRMLDTIREFGAFYLGHLGEQDTLRRRHRDHYRKLAGLGDASWLGPDQVAWYDRMTAEHDNLRAALEFALECPGEPVALELVGDLWFYWYGCGFAKEGAHFLERALAAETGPGRARTKALWVASLISTIQGDGVSGLELARQCEDQARRQGDASALEHGRSTVLAAILILGDGEQMMALSKDVYSHMSERAELTMAYCLSALSAGAAYNFFGSHEEAMAICDLVNRNCDRHGERLFRSHSDIVRTDAELNHGRPEAALSCARSALKIKHRLNDHLGVAIVLDLLGRIAVAMNEGERAACLLGVAQQVWNRIGRPQIGIPTWVAARRECEVQARRLVGDPAYERAYQAGYDIDPLDIGIAYAGGAADAGLLTAGT